MARIQVIFSSKRAISEQQADKQRIKKIIGKHKGGHAAPDMIYRQSQTGQPGQGGTLGK